MLNVILRVRHNMIVEQTFTIVKTWKWSKNAGKLHCYHRCTGAHIFGDEKNFAQIWSCFSHRTYKKQAFVL